LLVRHGKGGRRREIGMDPWGWEQLRPWLAARIELPVGPLFCVIDGPTRGRPWSSAAVRSEFRRLAAQAGISASRSIRYSTFPPCWLEPTPAGDGSSLRHASPPEG
jgi:hypothetical protein